MLTGCGTNCQGERSRERHSEESSRKPFILTISIADALSRKQLVLEDVREEVERYESPRMRRLR